MAESLASTDFEVTGLFSIIGYEHIWSTQPMEQINIGWDGIPNDRHSGASRIVRAYESSELFRREVVNDKQVSIVDECDLQAIADDMCLPVDEIEEKSGTSIAHFMANQLAANILLKGTASRINQILGSGTILGFGQNIEEIGGIIKITEFNEPCKKPLFKLLQSLTEINIQLVADSDSLKRSFKESAADKRGWVAGVYSVGTISVGDSVYVQDPIYPRMTSPITRLELLG